MTLLARLRRMGWASTIVFSLLGTPWVSALAANQQPDFARLANESVSEAEALKPQEELVAERVKEAKAHLQATAAYDAKYYDHQEWVLRYTRFVYYWHFLSTIIVFFLVVGIVIFGLRLSYLQFKKDMLLSRARRELSASASPPPAGTEEKQTPTTPQPVLQTIKLGLQGIEISSSVIGLLILALSLGFFYLYLEQVYPIKPGTATQEEANPTSPTDNKPKGK